MTELKLSDRVNIVFNLSATFKVTDNNVYDLLKEDQEKMDLLIADMENHIGKIFINIFNSIKDKNAK